MKRKSTGKFHLFLFFFFHPLLRFLLRLLLFQLLLPLLLNTAEIGAHLIGHAGQSV